MSKASAASELERLRVELGPDIFAAAIRQGRFQNAVKASLGWDRVLRMVIRVAGYKATGGAVCVSTVSSICRLMLMTAWIGIGPISTNSTDAADGADGLFGTRAHPDDPRPGPAHRPRAKHSRLTQRAGVIALSSSLRTEGPSRLSHHLQ